MNYGSGNLTKRARARREVLPGIQADADDLVSRAERPFKGSVVAVCCWVLIEAPLELSGSISSTSLLAVLASKILICLTGFAAVVGLRVARHVFAFICAASVLAVAPALPLEYAHSVAIALVSVVECVAKTACVVAFAIASANDPKWA
ncbi:MULTISPECIES: hypothetical protein [unclassified Paraburkholderia]|uniref:hypothetical protein n=1 Tax=unclassified Paraburkholderia TaxID=2615204 RepID=UPI0020B79C50|nr:MULTISPECIES: hypothetical protein [unclassified Paraburkholderia]MCP3716274.1 hypothetical protein [Paraburkholderia sp. CNPSo 3281]MCX5541080.1 hypothetical protein [Paraburkholderia sp. CNPSo 3076]